MGKSVFIAEKPSVAEAFADALKVVDKQKKKGYLENDSYIVTWCVGHLVTMSYPDAYDENLKKWRMETLPFLPEEFLYEIIPSAKRQYQVVEGLLNRPDVESIYVCTDSGREGEYIYRLVAQEAKIQNKKEKRVWIDSQTEEEIQRGIKEAKDLSEYDNLSSAAYLRAKEDYLMGINFSRVLTLRYGYDVQNEIFRRYPKMRAKYMENIKKPYQERKKLPNFSSISVGRVMTCVLGMVVRREREIRDFVKTPFYRVLAKLPLSDDTLEAEWKAVEGSKYFGSPVLYKDSGFLKEEIARGFMEELAEPKPVTMTILKKENKTEKKQAPLLFNLAELQNYCSKNYKISPDETLGVIQELYEKKLVTYPRTDARVLSTAIAKVIHKNISGLAKLPSFAPFANEILKSGSYKNIAKSKYCDDKKITDHYAVIPTGQGLQNLASLDDLKKKVYSSIVRRFLSIFYPPAEYKKVTICLLRNKEQFNVSTKVLAKQGYLVCWGGKESGKDSGPSFDTINALKKGQELSVEEFYVKSGETSPPKRYTSGGMVLAMENAGQLIEDETLREQIKGSGIGTSATRGEILKKLVSIGYILLNEKTQIYTPSLLGELIYEVVLASMSSLLNPELTASWEKGLSYVEQGQVNEKEYMEKLDAYVAKRTNAVKDHNYSAYLKGQFQKVPNQ